MTDLAGWENFYVIVGSSAGALIGLQFVVMTLLADIPPKGNEAAANEAFGTPNVVHFGVALLISAMISAPWPGVGVPAILWGIVGIAGVVYIARVIRRMQKQTAYKPVAEDWWFHAWLPLLAYAVLAVSGVAVWLHLHPRAAMFSVGGAALLLLFVGIHNAWDTVMYHVFVRRRDKR